MRLIEYILFTLLSYVSPFNAYAGTGYVNVQPCNQQLPDCSGEDNYAQLIDCKNEFIDEWCQVSGNDGYKLINHLNGQFLDIESDNPVPVNPVPVKLTCYPSGIEWKYPLDPQSGKMMFSNTVLGLEYLLDYVGIHDDSPFVNMIHKVGNGGNTAQHWWYRVTDGTFWQIRNEENHKCLGYIPK